MSRPISTEQILMVAKKLGMSHDRFKRREDISSPIFAEWCKQVYATLIRSPDDIWVTIEEVKAALDPTTS